MCLKLERGAFLRSYEEAFFENTPLDGHQLASHPLLPFAPRTATSPASASGDRLSLDGLIEVATFTLDGADEYR